MPESAWNSGELAGGSPRAVESLDGFSVAVKDARDDLAGRPLDGFGPLPLTFERLTKIGREGEPPPFPVLGLTRFQAEPAAGEIHVLPLPGEDLRADPPAGDVGDLGQGFDVLGRCASTAWN